MKNIAYDKELLDRKTHFRKWREANRFNDEIVLTLEREFHRNLFQILVIKGGSKSIIDSKMGISM